MVTHCLAKPACMSHVGVLAVGLCLRACCWGERVTVAQPSDGDLIFAVDST